LSRSSCTIFNVSTMATARDDEDLGPASVSIEHALSHWVRLVSKFIEMGEPMDQAMTAAARIVAFASTGPLREGENETRRNRAPESGVVRRRAR
jgi:hypothetical protein